MNSKKVIPSYGKTSESRMFLSAFSHSSSDQFIGPTPKKPKLDIAKSGSFVDAMSKFASQLSYTKKEDSDEALWGDEFDPDELKQVDEYIALSQMTQSMTAVHINHKTVSIGAGTQKQSFVNKITPEIKNGPKVPLRRTSSSQWPSSSHNVFSPCSSNVVKPGKGPSNTTLLHGDIEKLKMENMRIIEELNKKTGEARILRDKVNSAEKEKEKIRKEYTSKMETLKAEAERNNNSLLKQIKSLTGQLEVKNMEIKTAERKQIASSVNRIQPDSPMRISSSSRLVQKDSNPECELDRNLMKTKAQSLPLKFLRDSVMPELLEPSHPEAPLPESARAGNPCLFSGVLRTEGGRERRVCPAAKREVVTPHTSASSCAALLLSPGLVDITNDFARQTISQMVDICHKILIELLKKLESSSCSNSQFTERERELLMTGCRQLPLDKEYDLISHRELYGNEKGIEARRALGFMSLLLQASNITAKKILSSGPNESTDVLETVRSIVRLVEKQRRTLAFQGVLAGSVAVVRDLLESEESIPTESQALIVDVVRWVVSARPGCLVIHNVLQTLLAAERFPQVLGHLCHNSAEKTYKENPRHSIVQFTPDSCVLQVLCSLVKAAETPRKHRLTDLLTRWAMSLFCDGQAPPQWLTTAPSTLSCNCHALLCKLGFSLLSEACFAYPTADDEEQRLLERVLARGVLLTNVFMNEDEHMLAIVDPHSLGCYEHFLHFMSNSKITLDSNTHDFLGFLCNQEEVLKQSNGPAVDGHSSQLQTPLRVFIMGDHGRNSPNVLDTIDSL